MTDQYRTFEQWLAYLETEASLAQLDQAEDAANRGRNRLALADEAIRDEFRANETLTYYRRRQARQAEIEQARRAAQQAPPPRHVPDPRQSAQQKHDYQFRGIAPAKESN